MASDALNALLKGPVTGLEILDQPLHVGIVNELRS